MVPHLYGLIGLVANTVGAALLLAFPPAVTTYTPTGEQIVPWSSGESAAGRRHYRRQVWGFRLAIALLIVGFVLQGYDLLTS